MEPRSRGSSAAPSSRSGSRTPEAGESNVRIEARRRLRGLSRLGSVMMRRATGRTLKLALDGIERALVPAGMEGS